MEGECLGEEYQGISCRHANFENPASHLNADVEQALGRS